MWIGLIGSDEAKGRFIGKRIVGDGNGWKPAPRHNQRPKLGNKSWQSSVGLLRYSVTFTPKPPIRSIIAVNFSGNLEKARAAIEAMEPVPAESVPKMGTFRSAQHPEWPPLPGNVNILPAWDLGGGCFLLDDLDLGYPTGGFVETSGRAPCRTPTWTVKATHSWMTMLINIDPIPINFPADAA